MRAATAPALARHRRPLNWRIIGQSVLAGLLVVASFAPFEFFPGAWIAIALLMLAWRNASLFDAWVSGMAFGATVMATGGFWVLTSLINLGSFHPLLCTLAFSVYLVYQSLIISLVPLASRLVWRASDGLAMLVSIPAIWALGEILRGWMALPWLSPGYGQVGGPLVGFAPYLGVQGVTLFTVMAGGLLALAWLQRRAGWWRPASGLAGLIGLALLAGAYQFTQARAEPIRISLVQGNVPSDTQWDYQVLDRTLAMYRDISKEREAAFQPQVVIWPETAAPIHHQRLAGFFNEMAQHSSQSGIDYLVGAQSRIGQGEDALFYNIALHPAEQMFEYRKRELVPLGEFLPAWLFTSDYRKKMKLEAIAMFTPGADDQVPIVLAGEKVEIAICFESLFSNMLRRAPADAGMLVMLTNDELFMGTTMPYQHLQIARMRALETQRPVVRSANSGISAFIAASGEIVSRTPVRQRAFLDGSVEPRHGLTPYMRWGDAAPMLLSGLLLAISGLLARVRRARGVS